MDTDLNTPRSPEPEGPKDSRRRFSPKQVGGGLAIGFLILLVLAVLQFSGSRERQARHTLDRMLEGADSAPEQSLPDAAGPPGNSPHAQRDQEDGWSIPGFGGHGGGLFDMPFSALGDTGVEVRETPDRYILRVPVTKPGDADSIRLNVAPHRIEVSGQSGSGKEGAMVRSSFMQSFSTSDEVLPGAVQRRTEKRNDRTELVIIIPKKHAGQGVENRQAESPPDTPDDMPEEIPLGNPDEHKVI